MIYLRIWQSNISKVLTKLQSDGINYETLACDITCEFLQVSQIKTSVMMIDIVNKKKFTFQDNPYHLLKIGKIPGNTRTFQDCGHPALSTNHLLHLILIMVILFMTNLIIPFET